MTHPSLASADISWNRGNCDANLFSNTVFEGLPNSALLRTGPSPTLRVRCCRMPTVLMSTEVSPTPG